MEADLFDQLASQPIPPAPPELRDEVHHRLNRALLGAHLTGYLLGAVPFAMIHLMAGIFHLADVTFFGPTETKQ